MDINALILVLFNAARNGHIEIVKLCKEWGVTDFNWAMVCAAETGHIDIVKLCRQWGATDNDRQCVLRLKVVKLTY